MQDSINKSLRMIITKANSPKEFIEKELGELKLQKVSSSKTSSPDYSKNMKSLMMLKEK